MPETMTNDDILQIIDDASERMMKDIPPEIDLSEDAEITQKSSTNHKNVTKIIENSTEQLVFKQQKEQSDMLSEEIRNRFTRLKKISKENFNMFEVAMLCHKLSSDYKKLARLNGWKEIEGMFD